MAPVDVTGMVPPGSHKIMPLHRLCGFPHIHFDRSKKNSETTILLSAANRGAMYSFYP